MLNFTLKPGEYFTIGDDIKVVITGGTKNNYRIMVDAPRKYNIVRNRVLEKNAATQEGKDELPKYYPEPELPPQDIKRFREEQQKEKDIKKEV